MNVPKLRTALLWLAPLLVAGAVLVRDSHGGQEAAEAAPQESEESSAFSVQYLEIVTPDRDATCALLEKVHGVSFGEPVVAFGNARTAKLAGGGLLGVREPMRATEEPVVRPYLVVDDIQAAVEQAAASGAEIAIPPMGTVDGGQFAIYLHGGIDHGLWKP